MHATPLAPYFKHANVFGYIKYIGPPPFLKRMNKEGNRRGTEKSSSIQMPQNE